MRAGVTMLPFLWWLGPGCASPPPEDTPPAGREGQRAEGDAKGKGRKAEASDLCCCEGGGPNGVLGELKRREDCGTKCWDDFFTGSDSKKDVGDTCSPK